ncbi:MAG: hypothetical protein HFJ02_00095 [Bacilli bacterium]|nr:hypothetical protein [Bacilli bacterium]
MNITDLILLAIKIGDANEGFCAGTANIWQIVGYVMLVFRIAIPILLIIYGALDLGKAVIASKDDEIKKATKGLTMRAIAAVAIFLIPTIVSFVFGMVAGFGEAKEDFDICKACITSPGGNTCDGKASEIWNSETSKSE